MPFWTGAMGSHDDSAHQGSAKRNALNGVAGLDGDGQLGEQNLPTPPLFTPVWKAYFTRLSAVVGDGPLKVAASLQTSYDVSLTGVPGMCRAAVNDLDEIKDASVFLPAGSYRLDVAFAGDNWYGILEILFGATSLMTADTYRALPTNNLTVTANFSVAVDTTADLRIRANGKNVFSTGYEILASYVRIIRLDPGSAIQTIPFTGNATQNRAIAHALGKKPKHWMAISMDVATNGGVWAEGMGAIVNLNLGGSGGALTECTAANVYVGTAGFETNANLKNYVLVVFG